MGANFSIIIPAYNEELRIGQTMRAVSMSLENPSAAELIVVDDASEDRTGEEAGAVAEQLCRGGLPSVVVPSGRRSGVAGAKNVGQLFANTPVSIFLDAHCVPGTGSLDRVAAALLSGAAHIVGPTMVSLPQPTLEEHIAGKLNEPSTDTYAYPNVAQAIEDGGGHYAGVQRIEDYGMTLKWVPFQPGGTGGLVRGLVVPGGGQGVRTDSGINIFDGLFDDRLGFPWGAEDAELSLRAWRMGLSVATATDAFLAVAFKEQQTYGVSAVSQVYNALRLAYLYLSADVFEAVLDHHRDYVGRDWAIGRLLRSDAVDRRRTLDRLGPPELADLIGVIQSFGGLDLAVGADRKIAASDWTPPPITGLPTPTRG